MTPEQRQYVEAHEHALVSGHVVLNGHGISSLDALGQSQVIELVMLWRSFTMSGRDDVRQALNQRGIS